MRHRSLFNGQRRSGAYWALGAGLGAAWSAGLGCAALPLHAEVGVQTFTGDVSFGLGLRERFSGLVGTRSPPWDMLNSAQLVLQIGIWP